MNQVQMRQSVVGRRRVEGGYQVLVDLWLMLGGLYETLLVPVLMYGSETMILKEEKRSRIRAVQMDKIKSLLGIRRMDRVPNARKRELCGMAKGVDERMMFSLV